MKRKSGAAAARPLSPALGIMRTLILTARALEERFDSALADVGLSGPKYGALTVLVNAAEPLSLGDLAARLTCVRSNITQLIDRLEADGLVRRVNDPFDRRGKRAAITALGARRRAAGARVVAKIEKEMGPAVSALDHHALRHVLEALQ